MTGCRRRPGKRRSRNCSIWASKLATLITGAITPRYVIKRDDLIGDVQRQQLFDWQFSLRRIDQPVDKTDWYGATPQIVNAEYKAEANEMVFPAGILQPPFFDSHADVAVNYGGIGAVMGHEISHGFDNIGSKFDADGNVADWWTSAEQEAFSKRTSSLSSQYGAFEALPGLPIDGANTLGENIADTSGLAIALVSRITSLSGDRKPRSSTAIQAISVSFSPMRKSGARRRASRPCASKSCQMNIAQTSFA